MEKKMKQKKRRKEKEPFETKRDKTLFSKI